ncbi:MAG: SDR family oxidoreductase [Rhodocyclaceae bacterium]|nr:SDR family oxidoreductase [Rhodocyclaceae bacterium]
MKDKQVVLTGGTSGIGFAVARRLAAEGCSLTLIGRSEERLAERIAQLSHPARHQCVMCDLHDTPSIRGIASALPPRVDAFVHAAGVTATLPLRALSYERMDALMRVNVYAFVELSRLIEAGKKANAPHLTSVVALSSIAATRGGKGQTAYSASKAALEACITTLAKECVRKRIRFNAVRPGLVDTEMTRSWLRRAKLTGDFDPDRAQLSGMADPADIAALIAFLVSDDSRHIVGSHIPIDGGGPLSTLD